MSLKVVAHTEHQQASANHQMSFINGGMAASQFDDSVVMTTPS